ncbi:hypothetical protein F7231_22290 [Fibrella aestuarina]|uniref:SD-repeat containing protein B domain-containing protein n=1 Tax=Fibrivirga algicola TaxID=2950420 RepID=A0ABX0QQR8_9BACT|nr:hypothetical protein [Fibrivirga algicola]
MILRLLVPLFIPFLVAHSSDPDNRFVSASALTGYQPTASVRTQARTNQSPAPDRSRDASADAVGNSTTSSENDCGLRLLTNITGCYSVSGLSKATVSAEVSWTSVPDGEAIIVQLGDQTRTIRPRLVSTLTNADVQSPQLVAFEIEATGSPISVSVSYTTCTISSTVLTPTPCQPLACAGLGGTVYKDFNADGIHQSGESTGLPDIVVQAITSNGSVLATSTDSLGRYTLAVPAQAYPVRVEFSNVPTYAGNGTPAGTDGRTTVQFVGSPNCGVDLGVLNAQEHCQTDPFIIVPCFVNGDPLPGGSPAGVLDAIVAFPYSLRGNKDMSRMTPLATASQVGSLWGTAYNKFTKRLFTSAVMRRHVGLGPGGLGGIYVTDLSGSSYSSATTNLFVDVTSLGIDLGTIPSNSARGLVAEPATANYDLPAFAAVGKVGMGDMDMAEDGSLLWFTNLHDGQLYSLRVPASGAPGPSDWAAHSLPTDITCQSGQRRIWGVKTYQGKVYVGTVCDASLSKDKRDLRAVVYAYTPGTSGNLGSGGSFRVIFDFPLTYPKGAPDRTDFSVRGWFPWEDDFNKFTLVGTDAIIHPQPILADIQFDIDGSMVLGFNDRSGLQLGFENFGTNVPDEMHYVNMSGGDVLRAYFSNGTYVLENGGKAGPNVGASTANNEGPGGGEFYNDDFLYDGALVHTENANGAIAIRPGSGEVVVSTMDPLNNQSWSGGIRYLSNTTGYYTSGNNASSAYVVYRTLEGDGSTFGKATGLGGVSLTCDLPTYLQLGNRVWQDDDQDGEQDPDEKGLPGVQVALYQNGALITTTTTDVSGDYYFTYSPTSSTIAGTTTDLLPNTTYQIAFGAGGQFTNNVLTDAGGHYQLTTANATGGTRNDINDSDAQISNVAGLSVPIITVTTGNLGSVDHSLDAGFYCLPTLVASVSVTPPTCPASGTIAQNDGRIDLSGIQNGDKAILFTAGTPPSYTATDNSRTVVAGQVSFTDLPTPATTSGTSYSIVVYNGPCCFTVLSTLLPQTTCIPTLALSVTPGACTSLTNAYTLTGVLSLTNAITDTAILTDGTETITLPITAGDTAIPFSLTGLPSGSGLHTVRVSYAGQTAEQAYTAPASCTVAADLAVSSTTVCAGETATLTAIGCELGTIQWTGGAVAATGQSVLVSTSYLAAITSPTLLTFTATCSVGTSVTTATATLLVNPKPAIELNSVLCAGPAAYTIVLTTPVTDAPLTYELVRGNSFATGTALTMGRTTLPATGQLSPLQQPGTYWVRVYNDTNCYTELPIDVQRCDCPEGKCLPLMIQRLR